MKWQKMGIVPENETCRNTGVSGIVALPMCENSDAAGSLKASADEKCSETALARGGRAQSCQRPAQEGDPATRSRDARAFRQCSDIAHLREPLLEVLEGPEVDG